MNHKKSITQVSLILAVSLMIILSACNSQKEEVVNLDEVIPNGTQNEWLHAYPDLKITLVAEKQANVDAMFEDRNIRIDGVEDQDVRGRFVRYVLKYLEDPEKKERDKAEREAYNNLPPGEKMEQFIERMKVNYPDFSYEWVGLDKGNTRVQYGDNSLIIEGVESDGARQEIGHAIMRLQKEIDTLRTGEQEQITSLCLTKIALRISLSPP